MSISILYTALKDLLTNRFITKTNTTGTYWINTNYILVGNIDAYHKKKGSFEEDNSYWESPVYIELK